MFVGILCWWICCFGLYVSVVADGWTFIENKQTGFVCGAERFGKIVWVMAGSWMSSVMCHAAVVDE